MMSAPASAPPAVRTRLSVIVVADDDRVVQWNPDAEAMFGWVEAEAVGKKLGELGVIEPSDEGGESPGAAVSAAVAWEGVHRSLRKDGTSLSISSSVVPFETLGQRLAVVTSVEATPRDHRVADSHWLPDLVEAVDVPIVGVNTEGIITLWNGAARRVYGYTAEECIGRAATPLIDVDCEPVDPLERIRDAGGASVDVELAGRRKDGTALNLVQTFSPIFDASGALAGYTIVARDLDERNRLMAEVKLERDRLMQAQAAGHVGSFELDLKTGQRWSSIEYCRLHGAPTGVPLERERWLASIHPDDRAKADRLTRSIRNDGRRVDFNYRVQLPQGRERRLEIRIRADLDEQGSPVRLHGTALDITERNRAARQLERLAYRDPLTGLANRAALSQEVDRLLSKARREGTQIAIFFLDVDRMKVINDGMGHAAGDELLVQLAHRLRASVRPGDLLARFAGDEFVIACAGIDETDARHLARRIAASVHEPLEVQSRELFVTVSIGIALSSSMDTTDSLLDHADAAMYRSKAAGRGAEVVFDENMARQALARLEMESGLQRALSKRQIEVHYQPIVDVTTGKTQSVESLLRWRRASNELTPPGVFLPIAEEIGLIGQLGRWGLGQALADLRRWRDEVPGAQNLRTAVNFSARQLQDPDIVDVVTEALALAQIEPSALKVEVTESILMENLDLSFDILTELRDRGIRISIDDFGTGYSSLSYLQRLPITTLKIDRSFISGLDAPADDHSQKIVETILVLARSMDLDVIAEGVETPAQLAILRKLGVTRAQGFLWSGALPADEIDSWLRDPQRAL